VGLARPETGFKRPLPGPYSPFGDGPSGAVATPGVDALRVQGNRTNKTSSYVTSMNVPAKSSSEKTLRPQSLPERFHRCQPKPAGPNATTQIPATNGRFVSTPNRIRTGDLLRERRAATDGTTHIGFPAKVGVVRSNADPVGVQDPRGLGSIGTGCGHCRPFGGGVARRSMRG
jgi:hypothetical protein